MAAGFTPQQIQSLENFIDQKLNALFDQLQNRSLLALLELQRSSAPPSAPPPAPLPELPPLPPTDPPSPAYPTPPLDKDTLKEVEYKQAYKSLRTIRQQPIALKHRASKALPKNPRDAEVFGNCIAWPPESGGTNMRLSRDEHLDAWYTTMLNTRAKAQQI